MHCIALSLITVVWTTVKMTMMMTVMMTCCHTVFNTDIDNDDDDDNDANVLGVASYLHLCFRIDGVNIERWLNPARRPSCSYDTSVSYIPAYSLFHKARN